MSLWAKLEGTEEPTISSHGFASIFGLWAAGEYDAATAQAALNDQFSRQVAGGSYTMPQEELDQATALLALYTAAPPQRKLEWIVRLEIVGFELRAGRVTVAQAQAMLTI